MEKRRETVTKVIDGDTFETASRKHPVRLANVDAPEKRQPGYQRAKGALPGYQRAKGAFQKAIEGQKVEVNTVARDPYGRPVANVKVDGKSVNVKMRGVTRTGSNRPRRRR